MLTHTFNSGVWISIALAGLAHAHVGAFFKGMYCINVTFRPSYRNFPAYISFTSVLWQGSSPVVNLNNNEPTLPLYQLSYSDYWMHHHPGHVNFNLIKHTLMLITTG